MNEQVLSVDEVDSLMAALDAELFAEDEVDFVGEQKKLIEELSIPVVGDEELLMELAHEMEAEEVKTEIYEEEEAGSDLVLAEVEPTPEVKKPKIKKERIPRAKKTDFDMKKTFFSSNPREEEQIHERLFDQGAFDALPVKVQGKLTNIAQWLEGQAKLYVFCKIALSYALSCEKKREPITSSGLRIVYLDPDLNGVKPYQEGTASSQSQNVLATLVACNALLRDPSTVRSYVINDASLVIQKARELNF
jgi:hypothetical protein